MFERIGKISRDVIAPVLPCPQPYGYRNRVMVRSQWNKPEQKLNIGFVRWDCGLVEDIDECKIAEPPINEQIKHVRAHPPPKGGDGWQMWNLHMLTRDFGQLCRYAAQNRSLVGTNVRVVFMGDSITDNWINFDKSFFTHSGEGQGVIYQVFARPVPEPATWISMAIGVVVPSARKLRRA